MKSGLGVIVQGSQRTFMASCSSRPAIIQADEMNRNYKAEFALTRSEVEVRGTYWIAPDFGQYSFTMDMGCAPPDSSLPPRVQAWQCWIGKKGK